MSEPSTAGSSGQGGKRWPFARLAPLDRQSLTEHAYLEPADLCCVLADYRAGDYRRGRLNQLLANFKCPPSLAAANPARLRYKRCAIDEIARRVRATLERKSVEAVTWVPIPPSKAFGERDYDDRLARTLRAAFRGYDLDVRALLYQLESTPADHGSRTRLGGAALYRLLRLDREALGVRPLRDWVLFDDVLTSGKHYKCCERRLREQLPQLPICGCFLARRVLPLRWRDPSGRWLGDAAP